MHSMAIKINVFYEDQKKINDILKKAGYESQRRKFHCTIGFIEKVIPEEEALIFGQKITRLLQEVIEPCPLLYEVEKAAHLFGHVIAFLPAAKSLVHLKKINIWLFDKVKEISEGQWSLNEETFSLNYIPHLTLWRARHPDSRFKELEEVAETHPAYQLSEAAYVIF